MSQSAFFSGQSPRGRWLLVGLVVICTGIEGFLQFSTWLNSGSRIRTTVYEYGGFWVGLLQHWQPNYTSQPYIMFLTYGFLHGGFLHLTVNMVTLWSLGSAVLDRVGVGGFLLLYHGTMIGGGVGYALLVNNTIPMVGASGALFGLAGGLLAWTALDRQAAGESFLPVLYVLTFLVALNLMLWWAMEGHLAWQTHLGGFVSGGVLALLINRRPVMH